MVPHATDSISSANRSETNGTSRIGNGDAATVLIVGSGIGGLMTALQCWRKGLSIKSLERSAGPVYTEDNLTIQPSAMSIFRHWPELCKEIEEEQYDCWMSDYRHSGQHIYGPKPPSFNDPENTVGRNGPRCVYAKPLQT
ncbi:hypothetical protein HO133_008705 [Letharia lupina]|uniref:FAD-binding domain-containing protein n=1 Tax=Letharia lupina TaxID=560253 RepID=A0A8H6CPI8_9LECA|nr:uncharacterized protein HO133_008705 [Letharia lupina]KAF6227262.1 hypothetical protein HO133_008705 [Letharia lupina]